MTEFTCLLRVGVLDGIPQILDVFLGVFWSEVSENLGENFCGNEVGDGFAVFDFPLDLATGHVPGGRVHVAGDAIS